MMELLIQRITNTLIIVTNILMMKILIPVIMMVSIMARVIIDQ